MMPNIVRGDRMAGLMTYLVGEGRSNEHEEPHLVAGDDALLSWHGDAELSRESGIEIARHLDRPNKAFDTEISGGHVWHCSLSLRAEEGKLSDEKWGDIARDFMKLMDLDDNEGTKAPTRWVAVRHGVSKNGNDHIHIAVNLVREDGTKANVHNDFHRAQKAARALESKYGLEELESVRGERATRGYDPAEREAQARARARAKYERARPKMGKNAPAWEHLTGEDRQARIVSEQRVDQPRYELARTVRAAATAAQSEDEFVRRMRKSGLIVRPRFADGRNDVVTGYSVALRPRHGERPIWYGGGHLGRDLTLPRLRGEWSDTPQGATDAAAEWNAAYRGKRVVSPGREASEIDPQMYERMNTELGQLRDQLRTVPLEDRDTWSRVARDTAGAFAAWSKAVEDEPGPLAATADALSCSAQTYRRPVEPKPAGMVAVSGAAMLLASAMRGGQGAAAQAVMIRQLAKLAGAVYDAAMASGEARQAATILEMDRTNLRTVHAQLERYAAASAPVATLDPEVAQMQQRIAQLNRGVASPAEAVRMVEHNPVPNRIEAAKVKQPVQGSSPEAER